MFWETPPIESEQLRVAERTHINASCSRKIKLKCVYKSNVSIGLNHQTIATIDTPHSLITVPAGIIKFNIEGITYTLSSRTVHLTPRE